MTRFSAVIFYSAILATISTRGENELGPFEEARAAWPDAFVPGNLIVVDYNGEPHYAFAGEAEDFFPDEGFESEAELQEEAILDAKARFFSSLSGNGENCTVSMKGVTVAYRWVDGPMHYVVCIVPKRLVSVSPDNSTQSDCGNSVMATPSTPDVSVSAEPAPETKDRDNSLSKPSPDPVERGEPTTVENAIRICRQRLTDNPNDLATRLRLARLFGETGQDGRAKRHYAAIVRHLATSRGSMSVHDAASAVIEAARHAESIRDEASALKFYRVALRLGDVELQPEITAKIARLKLKIDAPDHTVRPEHPSPGAGTHSNRAMM